MYFISKGEVEVSLSDGTLLGVLKSGDFFGEISIVFKCLVSVSWIGWLIDIDSENCECSSHKIYECLWIEKRWFGQSVGWISSVSSENSRNCKHTTQRAAFIK